MLLLGSVGTSAGLFNQICFKCRQVVLSNGHKCLTYSTSKHLFGSRLNPSLTIVQDAEAVKDFARREIAKRIAQQSEAPFETLNLSQIVRRWNLWQRFLPQVKPFYAVKVNEHPLVVQSIARLGLGFDCASKAEIDLILQQGVNPSRIIYAHTVKPSTHLTYARDHGVILATFDSNEEIDKIKRLHPCSKLLLRVAIENPYTDFIGFDTKFGAKAEEFTGLLKHASELKVDVVGASFHIGSESMSGIPYETGIRLSSEVFNIGLEQGHNMHIVDIGGGFPGTTDTRMFEEFAAIISKTIEHYFAGTPNLKLCAEPGAFFIESPVTLYCSVFAVKKVCASNITGQAEDSNDIGYMYYVTEGVYGTFTDRLRTHTRLHEPNIVNRGKNDGGTVKHWSTIWGPTCDPHDSITTRIKLPKLEEGEWLEFPDKGAYNHGFQNINFNGFPGSDIFVFYEEQHRDLFQDLHN